MIFHMQDILFPFLQKRAVTSCNILGTGAEFHSQHNTDTEHLARVTMENNGMESLTHVRMVQNQPQIQKKFCGNIQTLSVQSN